MYCRWSSISWMNLICSIYLKDMSQQRPIAWRIMLKAYVFWPQTLYATPAANIFKTYEADRTKKGFRIIWVHSSAKQEDDQIRRLKKIDKAIAALEILSPKLNAYHLKTKKEIKAAVDSICKGIKPFLDVRILTERKQIKVKVLSGRPSLKSVYKNKWSDTPSNGG